MRFTRKKQLVEDYWDDTERIKTKFLWWPMTINNETRWLETAEVMYKVKKENTIILPDTYYYWAPMKFINK